MKAKEKHKRGKPETKRDNGSIDTIAPRRTLHVMLLSLLAFLADLRREWIAYRRDNLIRTRCPGCGHVIKLWWNVDDATWLYIVPERWQKSELCLECFDDLARERETAYVIKSAHFHGDTVQAWLKKDGEQTFPFANSAIRRGKYE